MKRLIALAVAFVAAGAQTVSADPLMKYDYFDAAYQWTKDVEDGGDGGNGVDAKISYSPIENFALEGGYNYMSVDDFDINENVYKYGVAGWYSFCDGIDLVGRVGGIHVEANSSLGSIDQDGVYTGAQVRTLLTDGIEGNADVTYNYVSGGGFSANSWVYGLGAIIALTDDLAFKAGTSLSDDSILTLTGGLRLAM